MEKLRILVADDDAMSRKLLESTLSKLGFDVVCAADGNEALRLMEEKPPPDMAILDWMMPGIDGVEVCRRFRKQQDCLENYTFIILLTAKTAVDDIVTGIDSGADDYLSKPFDMQELAARIRAGRRIVELHDQLCAAKTELLRISMTDALTGILNRRAIYEKFEKELVRSSREKNPLCAIMFDIDFFKKINDTHGHGAGDMVLKEFASRTSLLLRQYDIFGRYGGEEFLVIMPGASAESAVSAAERIRSSIRSKPFTIGTGGINVTASFGVAQFNYMENSDSLISRADAALYIAKQNGRDRVEFAG